MNEMMSSGIELMLIGMGIVYLFLGLLVLAIKTMSWLISRYFPDIPQELPVSSANGTHESLVIAAISAAVHQYRHKQ